MRGTMVSVPPPIVTLTENVRDRWRLSEVLVPVTVIEAEDGARTVGPTATVSIELWPGERAAGESVTVIPDDAATLEFTWKFVEP